MLKKFDDPMAAMRAVSELQQRSKEVPINDEFSVTVRTLGAKDETESFIDCMHLWGQAFLLKHKMETLCRAITYINETPIESVSLDDRRQIIGQWNQELIDQLYLEYAKMLGSIDDFMKKIELTAQTNVVGVREEEMKADSNQEENNG